MIWILWDDAGNSADAGRKTRNETADSEHLSSGVEVRRTTDNR